MKHLKITGLAVVAAMALMAFGAGSASADVLCKEAVNKAGECPTGGAGDYASGTTITSESTNAKLTVEGGITSYVTCNKSNVSLENTSTGSNTSGAAVAGKITGVTWTECQTAGGSTCVVSESSGYTGSVKATDDKGNGTVTVNGTATTTVDCTSFGFNFKCTYKLTEGGLDLSLTGGNPASITASEQPLVLWEPGFGCGSGAKWDATYTLTGTTKALWVATKNV